MPSVLPHSLDHSFWEPPVTHLDYLGFRRFAPHARLAPWVQSYWIAKSHLPAGSFSENLYPDGGTSLMVQFSREGEAQLHFYARQSLHRISFSGPQDRLGIRFTPGGAFQLLGFEMGDITGAEHRPDVLNARNLMELEQRLSDAATLGSRLNILDDWLLQQAALHQARLGLIQHTLPRLLQLDESIDSLSDRLALGRRQLERKFRQEVGLPPAQIKQLFRIKHARRLICAAPQAPLTEVALAAGFYDQAHFIRQFQKVTGQTPGQYRQRKMSQMYNPE